MPEGQCPRAPTGPLATLSVIGTLFERIAMDFIRPLSQMARGYRFALFLMDYATWYPEVVPLRNTQAPGVARALLHLFAHVGLPREVVTDREKPFTSWCAPGLLCLPGHHPTFYRHLPPPVG